MASTSDITTYIAALNSVQSISPIATQIKMIADGVYEDNPILAFLNKNGRMKESIQGEAVTFPIRTTALAAEEYFGGSELSTGATETVKTGVLFRSFMNIPVVYHRTELLTNKGKDRLVPLVSDKLDEAREGMSRSLELRILGNGTTAADGTVLGPRPLIGLQTAVETNPKTTGTTYAGHTRSATTAWLNNQSLSIATAGALTSADLFKMFRACSHGGKKPDLIVTSEENLARCWALAKAEKWPMFEQGVKEAYDLGFPNHINFHGVPIIADKAMSSTAYGGLLSAELKRTYFLNTKDGLRWTVDPDDDMYLNETIRKADQHTLIQHLTWNGCLCLTNPRLNGVIYAAA